MKHKLYILSVVLMASAVRTDAFAYATTSRIHRGDDVELICRPSISYNKDVTESPGWKGNWFIGVNGGANALLGTPKGCNDLGGRIRGQFGINAGKWFTPSVGSRVSYTGFWLNNAGNETQDGWGVSSEILWNLTNATYGNGSESRFSLVPYLGMGMLHNRQAQTNPFALSYGVMAQYGITSALKLNLELGCKTTFSDFDGYGKPNRFGGDNMLSLSAGLSFTLGKSGFRKVVDAKPIIIENAQLRERLGEVYDDNRQLTRRHANDARALAELKKILEIEGLLSRYGDIFNKESDNEGIHSRFPVNDYSGLNSLRARLGGTSYSDNKSDLKHKEKTNADEELGDYIDALLASDDKQNSTPPTGNESDPDDAVIPDGEDLNTDYNTGKDEYIALVSSGRRCIGSPVFFFFRLGTSTLTDSSQLVNLDEIARIAKAYGLHVRVTGAADSATGTAGINTGLGNDRADYIIGQLQERGISTSFITKLNQGGIDRFNPDEANRHCKVELFLAAK